MPEIVIDGLEELRDKIARMPQSVADMGTETANEYLVNVLRAYPPRAQHGTSNPYLWNSDRQRRAFFATDGFGRGIPTPRTQELSRGWKTYGSGSQQFIGNATSYASYVMGDQMQHGHVQDGWSNVKMILNERAEQITRRFEAGVKKALKKLGLTDA